MAGTGRGEVIAALADVDDRHVEETGARAGPISCCGPPDADYEDIKPDRLEAQGVVRGVIRYLRAGLELVT
jgi:hypothetical protein